MLINPAPKHLVISMLIDPDYEDRSARVCAICPDHIKVPVFIILHVLQ